jgi:hypothetical protein
MTFTAIAASLWEFKPQGNSGPVPLQCLPRARSSAG